MGGRVLGELEEWFLSQLSQGDTFLFAGEVLRFEGLDEFGALATRGGAREPMIPILSGRQVSALHLSGRAGARDAGRSEILEAPAAAGARLAVAAALQVGGAAGRGQMLVETFPRADKYYMVCYPFEGRLAHQTLGMLLTRRLERWGAQPLGFVASEYALVDLDGARPRADDRKRQALAGKALRRGHAGR